MADYEAAPEGGIREVDENVPATPETEQPSVETTAPEATETPVETEAPATPETEADGDEPASSDAEVPEGSDEE